MTTRTPGSLVSVNGRIGGVVATDLLPPSPPSSLFHRAEERLRIRDAAARNENKSRAWDFKPLLSRRWHTITCDCRTLAGAYNNNNNIHVYEYYYYAVTNPIRLRTFKRLIPLVYKICFSLLITIYYHTLSRTHNLSLSFCLIYVFLSILATFHPLVVIPFDLMSIPYNTI